MAKIKQTARLIYPVIIFIFFGLILASFLIPKTGFQKAKEILVLNPHDLEAHLTLAYEFIKNNQFTQADKELELAQKKSDLRKIVLGTQTSNKLEELQKQKQYSDPKEINALIIAWGNIITEKPDYRDGYLQLAYLNYKLFENQKAKDYLNKAIDLDPNYKVTKELLNIIQ